MKFKFSMLRVTLRENPLRLVGSSALSVRRDAEEVKMGTKQTQFTVKDLETMSVGKIIQP